MRKITLGIGIAVMIAGSANATPLWNGAGWYQVADTPFGVYILDGPFEDQKTCDIELPENVDDSVYDCNYLAEQPSWDE